MSQIGNLWAKLEDNHLEIGGITSEEPVHQCPWKNCKRSPCRIPWHKPNSFSKLCLLTKLRPVILSVGVMEIMVGSLLVFLVVAYAEDFDELYGRQHTKIISLSSFGGLIGLSVSGMLLVTSVLLNKRGVMWFYVLTSTFLCVYIFVLSILMINFALLSMRKDSYRPIVGNKFYLSKACVIGILTLLGSVVHFIGTVAAFTFYNLKYIHPLMFNCPTS